jgi:hypothetical protein
MTIKRTNIKSLVDSLSDLFGSQEATIIALLDCLRSDGTITESQMPNMVTVDVD